MVKLIGFDLDGTIGDTLSFSMEAFRRAVSPYVGYTISDREIIETFGLNETGMIKKVAKDHWEDALRDFHIQYCNLHEQCPSPYEGIRHLLFFLKERGIKIALITGKGEKANPGYVFYTVEQLAKMCRTLNAGNCDNCIEYSEI